MGSTAVRLATLAIGVGLGLASGPAAAHPTSSARDREPLPTVEVVQPAPRRLRLLDVRGPLQVGGGYSSIYRSPVNTVSFEASVSFLALGERTWVHLAFGESAVISARGRTEQAHGSGFFGADVGLGLAHHTRRGPALLLTSTAGPRWMSGGPDRLRPHGYGVQTKFEFFPCHVTVPELVDDGRGWFRRFVLSGLNVWAGGRYDEMLGRRGNTWAAGMGLDVGRSVILPALLAAQRARGR